MSDNFANAHQKLLVQQGNEFYSTDSYKIVEKSLSLGPRQAINFPVPGFVTGYTQSTEPVTV